MGQLVKSKRPPFRLAEGDVVAAFDPGGTTGVCIGKFAPLTPSYFYVVDSQMIPWSNVVEGTLAVFQRHRPKVVISEQFTLRAGEEQGQIGSKFPSCEAQGIVRAWSRVYKAYFDTQEPVVMSRVEILDEHLPLLCKGRGDHAKDSYKHLRYLIVRYMHWYYARTGGSGV